MRTRPFSSLYGFSFLGLYFFVFLCGCNDSELELYEKAQHFWEKKMFSLSAQNYEQFSFQHPAHPNAAKSLLKSGEIYAYYLQDYTRGIEILHRVTTLYPSTDYAEDALERLADLYETHLKQYFNAIDQYKAIIKRRSHAAGISHEVSDLSAYYYRIARCYYEMKYWDQAIVFFRNAISNFPEGKFSDTAAYQVGYIYYLEERYQEAAKAFRFFLDKYPQSQWMFDGMLHLGRSLEKMDQHKEARHIYKVLKKKFPGKMKTIKMKKK